MNGGEKKICEIMNVLTGIIKGRSSQLGIRAWSAGCIVYRRQSTHFDNLIVLNIPTKRNVLMRWLNCSLNSFENTHIEAGIFKAFAPP